MSSTTIAEQVHERLRIHADLLSPPQRRALREAKGLSQRELADIVGVTKGAISNWERGVRQTPRGPLLDRYVEALRALAEVA